MFNKVVYICYFPLDDKFVRDYYIEQLVSNKIDVEYWDLSQIYFPHAPVAADVTAANFVTHINSLTELANKLNTINSTTLVIPQIDCDERTLKLFKILSASKCMLGFFARRGLPEDTQSTKLGTISRIINPIRVLRFLQRKLSSTGIRAFNIVFAASARDVLAHKQGSMIVSINHFDYDTYLDRAVDFSVAESPYAVFLDDNFLSGPDLQAFGLPTLDPVTYPRDLGNFFTDIEEQLGIYVVIAAHPHSNYPDGLFGNRPIIKNQTCTLVRDCEFVIAHASTSISFAVLHKKPIILTYTGEMERVYAKTAMPRIYRISDTLGVPIYKVGDELTVPRVNWPLYKCYERTFLSAAPGQRTADIFVNYLKEEHK
jgi:hypothetical protein